MFCECEWQAFFVCQYTHPHLLTKEFAQQILRLKVHSHLVLRTLVLSPLTHHASHLGLAPTYHERFSLS
jgi:hypothetical protein